jgi:hypothetical protein
MAKFHLTDQGGAQYEIDAPDEHAAIAALSEVTGSQKSEAAAAPATPSADVSVGGLAKAGSVGVAKGLLGAVGLVPQLSELAHGGANKYLFDPVFNAISGPKKESPEPVDVNHLASPESLQHGVEAVTGPFYKPQNRAEEYAQTAGEFLPGAIGGPGSVGTRLVTQALLPAVASETAGQATKGTMLETPARIGAAMLSPVALAGAQRGLAAARAPIDGLSRGAAKPLMQAVEADTPAAVQAQLDRLGPDAMLSDAGPALLGKAQGSSLNSDEGRSVMQRALTTRNEGTNARIADDVTRALGPAEDPATVTAQIRQHRSDVDEVNYPRATGANAPPVDTDGILVELGQMIGQSPTGSMEHKALTNLRNMMMTERRVPRPDPITGHQMSDRFGNLLYDHIPTPVTDPAILHKVKGEIDNVIEYDQPGLGIPAAALSRQQGALKHFRGMLNGEIENQVPGYLEANRASAGLARRGDAVDLGTKYLGSGKTTASPERFSDEFGRLLPGEQIAFAKGSRGNIDRILGTKANDLQALRGELQGEGGWNTAKIAAVHGQPSADELVASVDRNLKFRDTFNKVVENSQTEIRRAARENMRPTPAGEVPLINPNMTTPGFVLAGAKKMLNAGYSAVRPDSTRSYGDVARVLSATGAERDAAFQKIVDALNKHQATVAATAPSLVGKRALVAAALAAASARQDQSLR